MKYGVNSSGNPEKQWIPPYQVRGKLSQARNDKLRKTYVAMYKWRVLRKGHLWRFGKRFVDRVKGDVIPVETGIQSPHTQILSYRSSQDGLFRSISFNFHALFHFFICFSLWNADSQDSWTSYQTRRWMLYFLVTPSTKSFLCSYARLTRSEVTPVYKVILVQNRNLTAEPQRTQRSDLFIWRWEAAK